VGESRRYQATSGTTYPEGSVLYALEEGASKMTDRLTSHNDKVCNFDHDVGNLYHLDREQIILEQNYRF